MTGKLPNKTFTDNYPKKASFESLRARLKLKKAEAENDFATNHPRAHGYLVAQGITLNKIREHSARVFSTGALAGTLLLASPTSSTIVTPQEAVVRSEQKSETLTSTLSSVLPEKTRPLTREEEKSLEQVFEKRLGIKARASLEGEHLNTTYGLIGAEQHLKRYPGDSLGRHGQGGILKEGIAPGLGAWGYFARSESGLTPGLVEIEKWYAVVQTLYLPDWNKRAPYLIGWYKYRKVLIVNTVNGKAVVGAIADAGPAAWTGKHFGGSPEVMDYLGGPRYKKGPVIIFFVDDPENEVPLGPIEYN